MIEYFLLLLAAPLGILLGHMTDDEKPIYTIKRYFPLMLIGFFMLAIITYFYSQRIFLTSLFALIMIGFWIKQ